MTDIFYGTATRKCNFITCDFATVPFDRNFKTVSLLFDILSLIITILSVDTLENLQKTWLRQIICIL